MQMAIVGSDAVGKSSILYRLHADTWVEEIDPTIEDEYRIFVDVDSKSMEILITETGGPGHDWPHPEAWLKKSYKAYLLAFDITRKKTFEDAQEMYAKILRNRPDKDFSVVLMGTKLDLIVGDLISEQFYCAKEKYYERFLNIHAFYKSQFELVLPSDVADIVVGYSPNFLKQGKRQINIEEAEKFALEIGAVGYFETSALGNEFLKSAPFSKQSFSTFSHPEYVAKYNSYNIFEAVAAAARSLHRSDEEKRLSLARNTGGCCIG